MTDKLPRDFDEEPHPEPEPGTTIGNRPEMASETIPGGITEDEERIAAYDSRSTGTGAADERVEGRRDEWPGGHREGDPGPPRSE